MAAYTLHISKPLFPTSYSASPAHQHNPTSDHEWRSWRGAAAATTQKTAIQLAKCARCDGQFHESRLRMGEGRRAGMLPCSKACTSPTLLTDEPLVSGSRHLAPQSLPTVPSHDEIRLPPCVVRQCRAGACQRPLRLPGKICSPGCVGSGRRVGDGLLLQPPGH